jgi:hypothetical protein
MTDKELMEIRLLAKQMRVELDMGREAKASALLQKMINRLTEMQGCPEPPVNTNV